MILKDVVQWLLSESYVVTVNGELVFTKKCLDDLGTPSVTKVEDSEAPKQLQARPKVDLKDIWNKFITDAEVPHRVRASDGGIYTVRQFSKGVAARLVAIINKVDYKILVESTKNYYRTVSYKQLLSNYIEKDLWKYEYDEWLKNKATPMPTPGTNPFEI